MSNVPRRLVGLELALAFLPDIICCYRAAATIGALLLGVHPACPWLFSTALISDLFDGWLWRRYSRYHPWLARRPYIPCDLVADLTLILSGVAYAVRYWLQLDVRAVLIVVGIATAILQITPRVGKPSRLVFTICATLATHISCFIMLATTVIVWRVNSPGWSGPVLTLVAFYVIFALIGDKSRLIRRPPPGWRGLP